MNTSFNSRTPGGVRLDSQRNVLLPTAFQFTHPGRGATTAACVSFMESNVSIHAPREGCDRCILVDAYIRTGFNSRTPGGVRQARQAEINDLKAFQFTHPGRGATGDINLRRPTTDVSIHAPREGCDASFSLASAIAAMFQFTHPGRGATLGTIKSENDEPCFNSRTPGGVRH